MSLINEALRKARQAASEHDSQQSEGPFRPARAYPSRRSGRGGGLLAVALIAVAAGVIGASAAWWFLGDRQTQPAQTTVVEAPPLAAATPVAATDVSPTPVDLRSEAGSTGAPGARAPTPMIAQPADPRTDAEQDAAEPPPPESATGKPVADPGGDRVYVIEAELGYASLSLGFIVARSTNPFAEINGVDVYVGSEIDGFVIEAIEADRVVLRDDKGSLVLRVP